MGMMRTLTINGTKYDVVPVVPADSITLLADAWVSSGDVYSQVVEVTDVTPHTKVDLQPTSEQLADFHYKVLAFVAENNYGMVTVFAVGDKPTGDHTIQITKTEVQGTGPIRGNTVGTTMPRPDWNQTDPAKADYIKNKEAVDGHLTDASNPHGVTASQVGARPNTWTPTAADVGAAPASHATDKGNPHGVTAAQIGAAPAGSVWTATDPNNDGNIVLQYGGIVEGGGGTGGTVPVGGLTAKEVQTMIDAALAAEDELTEEEVQAMIDAALAAIPNAEEASF